MEAANQLVGPLATDTSPERKVVILEEKNAYTELVIQVLHFFNDLRRLANANDLAWRSSVESMNRTERTAAHAASTGK
jgi:hypothetical protein